MLRKALLCQLLLISGICFAQTKIIDPFKFVENAGAEITGKLLPGLSKFDLLSVTKGQALALQIDTSKKMILKIPAGKNKQTSIQLIQRELRAPGFEVNTSDGRQLNNYRYGKHYSGKILGNDRSIAAFSMGSRGLSGFYADINGNKLVEPVPGKSGVYVLYNDADLTEKSPVGCATLDTGLQHSFSQAVAQGKLTSTCKVVKMYIECDYSLYQSYNGNTDELINFVFGLFNAASTIFSNDGINIQLSELFIWTRPDIYTSAPDASGAAIILSNRLSNEYRRGMLLNAEIGHLLSARNLNGGAATRIGMDDGCNQANGNFTAAASGFLTPFAPFPSYSRTVFLFSHETGHMIGSPHTQSCGWPGGAIDNCAQPEGPCAPGPAPVNGGTIMSYCQSTQYGVNFFNGFGPLPAALLKYEIERRSCLASCADSVCANNLVNLLETSMNDTMLRLKWQHQYPKYRVGVSSNTSQRWVYYETTADSFVMPKTACEQRIQFSVTPFCSQLNKYGTSYLSVLGDMQAPAANFTNLETAISICADSYWTLGAVPYNGAQYKWYRNGALLQNAVSDTIHAYPTGGYSFEIQKNGCTYYSDTIRVQKPVLTHLISTSQNGLDVFFSTGNYCLAGAEWDFGDGGSMQGFQARHQYNQEGVYKITLKVWDTDGALPDIVKYLHVKESVIDSLNGSSTFGYSTNLAYRDTLCRKLAWFGADSLENLNFPFGGRFLRYPDLVSGNELFQVPKSGTIEMKLFPVSGLVKKLGTPAEARDTGYVLNGFPLLYRESNLFHLMFTKWGGLQLMIDSNGLGHIEPGRAGPLMLNQWNHIGFSYGDKGIKLMVNGSLYDSSVQVIDTSLFRLRSVLIGTFVLTVSPNFYVQRYYKGFAGGIDMMRFSLKQNDFTFSASLPWQGKDSIFLQKRICAGQTFSGLDKSGVYYFNNQLPNGCDSVTRLQLQVNDSIQPAVAIIHPLDAGKGAISISGISGTVPPLQYVWNTGDTVPEIFNLSPGSYMLSVKDSMGCTASFTYHLYQLNSNKDFVLLYPNPTDGTSGTRVKTGTVSASKITCTLFDATGRKIYLQEQNIPAGLSDIELQHPALPSGIYMLVVKTSKGSSTHRLVVL